MHTLTTAPPSSPQVRLVRLHAPRWPRNLKPSDRIYLFCSLFGDRAVATPVHGETPAVSLGKSAIVSESAVMSANWEGRGGEACLLGGAFVRDAQDGAFSARFDHELRATLKTTLPDEAFRREQRDQLHSRHDGALMMRPLRLVVSAGASALRLVVSAGASARRLREWPLAVAAAAAAAAAAADRDGPSHRA